MTVMKVSNQILSNYLIQFENTLRTFIKTATCNTRLEEAIQYSIFSQGKRIRPVFLYALADATHTKCQYIDKIAIAIELIHNYSLIHDDLPAMDDDDFRRGKLTCHKAFNEATAILAADALHSMAFEILSSPSNDISPLQQLHITNKLAQAAGIIGLAGGQALDLDNNCQDIETLDKIHTAKTASLFIFAAEAIAIINPTHPANTLIQFSRKIGLIFQLQDDILEATTKSNTLGKPLNSDSKNNKITHATLKNIHFAIDLLSKYQKEILTLNKNVFANNHAISAVIAKIFSRQH